LLRVTNTGISAYIDSRGRVMEQTRGFEPAVRSWTVSRSTKAKTLYARHGDLLAYLCALISLGSIAASFLVRRKSVIGRG
jgi:apolipoprotein N-acyltransferase